MPGTWTWTDAAIFIAVFTGIRIAVIWMATEIFTAILPEGDACPVCNAETYALERQGVWRVLGARFRRSFCIGCGWDGVMRRSDAWMTMLKERRVPAAPTASRRERAAAPRPGKWLELRDLLGRLRPQRMPQVPVLLEPQPEVGAHPRHLRQPKRRVRGDPPLGVDHLVESRKRDPQLDGERGLRDPQRLEELLQQHLARMRGRPMSRKPPLDQRRRPPTASGSP
jgi:hypothetical protein